MLCAQNSLIFDSFSDYVVCTYMYVATYWEHNFPWKLHPFSPILRPNWITNAYYWDGGDIQLKTILFTVQVKTILFIYTIPYNWRRFGLYHTTEDDYITLLIGIPYKWRRLYSTTEDCLYSTAISTYFLYTLQLKTICSTNEGQYIC